MIQNRPATAVVTGISSGIGLAMTRLLLDKGYQVVGTTKTGFLPALQHPNLTVVALDLNSQQQRSAAALAISDELDYIDLLINNAGIAPDVFSETPDLDSFSNTVDTNLTATVFFTELLIENMREHGKILFISSEMGLPKNAGKTGTAYRISKAGINMYAEILANRLSERGISVGAVHPGWVRTKLGGESAPISTAQSAAAILAQLPHIKGNGRFYNALTSQTELY